jgi:hypothetical protein
MKGCEEAARRLRKKRRNGLSASSLLDSYGNGRFET